jgi:hypothetical protein
MLREEQIKEWGVEEIKKPNRAEYCRLYNMHAESDAESAWRLNGSKRQLKAQ